jgi:DNA-binding response OmpR family regulator
MAMTGANSDSLSGALAVARARFIASFSSECEAVLRLIDAGKGPSGRAGAVEALVHKLSGRAGLSGFPTLARACADLRSTGRRARRRLGAEDCAREIVDRTAGLRQRSQHRRESGRRRAVLIGPPSLVERRRSTCGRSGIPGWRRLRPIPRGRAKRDRDRALKPAAFADVHLPGDDLIHPLSSVQVDPELARIPVSSSPRPRGRVGGLALGADDYLVKPVDMRELAIRVSRACARAWGTEQSGAPGVISYAEFFERGRMWLQRGPGSVVFIRTPPQHLSAVQALVRREVRTRDLVGAYDAGNLVLLMPETPASVRSDRLTALVGRLRENGITPVTAGVAASTAAGGSVMTLMRDAHEALIEARYLAEPVAVSGAPRPAPADRVRKGMSVLLVDDDPDVARIIDTQMRAAGHGCTLAFDGEQALAEIDRCRPDVVMLDLMMPKLGGFEVLARLNERGPRPAVVVIPPRRKMMHARVRSWRQLREAPSARRGFGAGDTARR